MRKLKKKFWKIKYLALGPLGMLNLRSEARQSDSECGSWNVNPHCFPIFQSNRGRDQETPQGHVFYWS